MVIAVSGRSCADLDRIFGSGAKAGIYLIAEHGAFVRKPKIKGDIDNLDITPNDWQPLRLPATGGEVAIDEEASAQLDTLVQQVQDITKGCPGAMVERKFWSVVLHFRNVQDAQAKDALLLTAHTVAGQWVQMHKAFNIVGGSEVLEVRPGTVQKSRAVEYARQLLGDNARILALGDDVTDEDMFAVLNQLRDVSIVVGPRASDSAMFLLSGPDDTHTFLRWLAAERMPACADVDGTGVSPGRRARAGTHASCGWTNSPRRRAVFHADRLQPSPVRRSS